MWQELKTIFIFPIIIISDKSMETCIAINVY